MRQDIIRRKKRMSVKYLKNFNFKRRLNNVEVIVQGEVEKKKIKREKKGKKRGPLQS